MKASPRLALVALLLALATVHGVEAAVSKLSQIANGGTVVTSTDQAVAVRNGNTDVLVTFAPSAAIDTTNATNITTGTLPSAQLPTLACSSLSNAATSCSTDATNFANDSGTISSGIWNGTAIANAFLAHSATTVNGQTCTLGSTCTTAAAASTLTGSTLASGVTASSLTSFGSGIALGTPASGVATNLTGTASGLTAGNVTTNANLTGDVTSIGNATTVAAIQSSPVLISSAAKNQTLIYNGTDWVNVAQGTSFTFAISSFTCNAGGSGTIFEEGTGTWKAIGALSFSATYSNGPATGGFVSHTGWSNLTLTGGSFLGPTTNATADSYPPVGTSLSYTLNATDGSVSPTSTISYTFDNRVYWGVTTTTSGYVGSDVTGLANNALTNSKARSFSITPTSGQYILWASPTRLGAVTFTVGGFAGGFGTVAVVSVTNASGFTENYNVYRSVNPNLGTVSVVTQ